MESREGEVKGRSGSGPGGVRGSRGGPGGTHSGGPRDKDRDRTRVFRKKQCRFCVEKLALPNYRDVEFLIKFLTEKGKIIPRRITGNCSKHQRALARAVKQCRHSALIAFQME